MRLNKFEADADMSFREKRFLLFMPEYVMGGAETQFRYLIEYAEQNRWKLDVVIEHRFKPEDSILHYDAAKMKNVRFYEIAGCGNDADRIIRYAVCHVLKNSLKVKYQSCLIQHAPDIVLAPVLRSFGIHVIYSERGAAEDVIKNSSWGKCLRYCNKITANSEYAQKKLEEFTETKVGLIRNGKPIVRQLPMRENREICRILVPARIVPIKNQMLMLRYLKEYPEYTGKVIFAGEVEDKIYQRKLSGFVNRNNLSDRVQFIGYVENMLEEYEKADLVVLPSWAEGTPNVVLEAYAYGRPVIVSDIEAAKEIVTDSHFRFKPNKPEDVNRCIEYFRSLSAEEYREMIEKKRRFVIRNYSVEKMVRQFYKLLTG